jgi:hypothetical protein
MDTIKKVSFAKVLGRVDRVYVEFSSGRKAYFDIREDENGKRRIFSNPSLISQEEIIAVKLVAKVDGKWTEYGYDEEYDREQKLTEMVKRGEAIYTYDREGMISGVEKIIKKNDGFLFDSAHGLEG